MQYNVMSIFFMQKGTRYIAWGERNKEKI